MSKQRELKFRAWATKSGKMIDLKAITPLALDKRILDDGDGLFIPFRDDIILMQFTGLLDRNGEEIYEGDIVRYDFGAPRADHGPVEWSAEECGWMLRRISSSTVRIHKPLSKHFEVIGDIHKNPELLSP